MGASAARIGRIELKRQQYLDLIVAAGRKSKITRHDTHDGCRLRIDLNLLADDVAFAAERALPKAMRDYCYARPTITIFFRREVATSHRLHPERINQPARDGRRSNAQGLAIGA